MRFAVIAATIFAATAATMALSLMVLDRSTSGPIAGPPCNSGNKYILDIKSWTAEAEPNAEIKISVTVGLNDIWDFSIFRTEKVARLSGFIFLNTKALSISDPREPIGVDDNYVYSQVIGSYDDDPLLTQPKGSIRAFACLTSWTLTNGQKWNAKLAGKRL